MQNLLEPEFLSSHGSCVRKQVNAQTAVNIKMERNLYSPVLFAYSDIQKRRPPSRSHFCLVFELLIHFCGEEEVGGKSHALR